MAAREPGAPAPTEESLDQIVARLDRRLRHVLEPAMRLACVREALEALSPEAACGLVATALARRPPDHAPRDLLCETIETLLADTHSDQGLGYEHRRELYECARAGGHEGVLRLLRSARPGADPQELARQLPPDVAELPLGVRRSLARGDQRHLLDKLALDPDPVVVRHLLSNPHTREDDVLRLAARRPVAASTLEEIARAPRWSTRERVRVAMARNPGCPLPLAARLTPGLPLGVVREMAQDATLPQQTRRVAEEAWKRRSGS